MKKIYALFLCVGVLWFCVACTKQGIGSDDVIIPENEKQEEVIPEEVIPEEVIPEEKHSEFYLEQYAVEDVLKYFNEVVLKTEYSTGTGDSTLVQRWDVPICYELVGDYTDEDVAVLEELFANLNQIDGFPGANPAKEDGAPNLSFYFEDRAAFNDRFLDFIQNEYADGAARYLYYTDTNDI